MVEKKIAQKYDWPVFETPDISLAAFLKMRGYKIVTSEKDKRWKILFGFDDSNKEKREQDVLAYFNNEGWYLNYTSAIKDLKFFLATKK